MYWFWIHAVLSVLLVLILIVAAANGFSIYRHKMMVSYRSLPALLRGHVKLGYSCAFLFLLTLTSGFMVRSWSGWYASFHRIIPLILIPLLIGGLYTGLLLKNCSGRRPLLHVFFFFAAGAMTFFQLLTGVVMLGLVWSS